MSDYLVPLADGRFAIVSEEDSDLTAFIWTPYDHRYTTYARKGNNRRSDSFLHRKIGFRMGFPVNAQVDHRNGHGLDRRRDNLRCADGSKNAQNRRVRITSNTGIKGVRKHGNRYEARIYPSGSGKRGVSLGGFSTPEEAGRAYDVAAIEYYGEFARLNFPEENH